MNMPSLQNDNFVTESKLDLLAKQQGSNQFGEEVLKQEIVDFI